ncbi:unnamed protein product [Boreogadus saida]
MPGSSATKAPTTGSEVVAETGNAAAPGYGPSIRRGEPGGDAPSSPLLESSDSEFARREREEGEGIVERDGKVVCTFSDDSGSVGSALSAFHRQRLTMLTQAERRERQEGMFMPQAALAHFMAIMGQDPSFSGATLKEEYSANTFAPSKSSMSTLSL